MVSGNHKLSPSYLTYDHLIKIESLMATLKALGYPVSVESEVFREISHFFANLGRFIGQRAASSQQPAASS